MIISTSGTTPTAKLRMVSGFPLAFGVLAMAMSQFSENLPSKAQIYDYWKHRLSRLYFHVEPRKPRCWACGFNYGARYDIKRPDAGWDEILQRWNRIPLQRCHIIPRSLNGSDSLSNLFLLCRECHDLTPNTSIPEVFFRWGRTQNWELREDAKLRDAMRAFRIDTDSLRQLDQVLNSSEFRYWMSGKFGLHRPQSNYAPISSRLTPATLVGLALHYHRELGCASRRSRGAPASKH
ncbi:HNH endonuclease [Bradyrhizobium australafricanum]|uniref:HNH endonuclease n=1 Tax=Bradyrhizobium australafricanum TaxID=2821406 RepID=UPI0035D691BB